MEARMGDSASEQRVERTQLVRCDRRHRFLTEDESYELEERWNEPCHPHDQRHHVVKRPFCVTTNSTRTITRAIENGRWKWSHALFRVVCSTSSTSLRQRVDTTKRRNVSFMSRR